MPAASGSDDGGPFALGEIGQFVPVPAREVDVDLRSRVHGHGWKIERLRLAVVGRGAVDGLRAELHRRVRGLDRHPAVDCHLSRRVVAAESSDHDRRVRVHHVELGCRHLLASDGKGGRDRLDVRLNGRMPSKVARLILRLDHRHLRLGVGGQCDVGADAVAKAINHPRERQLACAVLVDEHAARRRGHVALGDGNEDPASLLRGG